MSKCNVVISTQRSHYQLGDTVRGQVTVEVDKECKCDGLSLEKFWSTHGKGNRSSGGAEKIELFQGTWQPGTYTYAFSFKLDEGPFSYHGHIINVDWYLSARADIPWAIDPKDEIEFILEKTQGDQPGDLEAYKLQHTQDKSIELKNIGKLKYLPLVIAVAGMLLIYFDNAFFFGGIITIAGFIAFYKVMQSSIAEKKLGDVQCVIDESNLRAGDNMRFSISFIPKSNVSINAATVKVIGREVAVSGSGTNRTTHTHTFYTKELNILSQGNFTKDFPVSDKHRLEIPSEAALSFRTSDNSIEWLLQVEIDIPKWPDWEENLPFTVIP